MKSKLIPHLKDNLVLKIKNQKRKIPFFKSGKKIHCFHFHFRFALVNNFQFARERARESTKSNWDALSLSCLFTTTAASCSWILPNPILVVSLPGENASALLHGVRPS